jgi:hypothetical protein
LELILLVNAGVDVVRSEDLQFLDSEAMRACLFEGNALNGNGQNVQ